MTEKPLISPDKGGVISLSGETKFASNGIVSRTILNTKNSRTILFGFDEGQELSEHTSTQHAIVQILSGECEFSLDGEWQTLETGTLLHMPPHLPHAVKASKAFSMLLTLIKPDVSSKSEIAQGEGHC